jgi:hypothetical protein
MLHTTADPYAAVGGQRTHAAYSWSNFSHNVAGLVLLAMSLLALAASRPGLRWARHWPLGIALPGPVFRAQAGTGLAAGPRASGNYASCSTCSTGCWAARGHA